MSPWKGGGFQKENPSCGKKTKRKEKEDDRRKRAFERKSMEGRITPKDADIAVSDYKKKDTQTFYATPNFQKFPQAESFSSSTSTKKTERDPTLRTHYRAVVSSIRSSISTLITQIY